MATALIETGTGLSLLGLPALIIWLLLGVREPSPEVLVVSRVCGVGLLTIGVACWPARDDSGSRSQHGLLWALLIYNVGVSIVLAFSGLVSQMAGVALWLVVGLHAAMTIWCVRELVASPADDQNDS